MYATRDSYYPQPPVRRSRLSSSQRPRRQSRGPGPSSRTAEKRVVSRNGITGQNRTSQARYSRRRVTAQQQRQSKVQQHVAVLTRETMVKLSINTVLIGLSATALAKLVPSHLTQRSQLREIRAELAFTQTRVDKLRFEFSRTFDPMQAKSVMQQQSHLIDPNQRPVVFTPKVQRLDAE